MNTDEILIKAEGVGKKFCRKYKKSLFYGFVDSAKSIFGIGKGFDTLRSDEFWAVNDVSFELRRGECLGLIGHNGAGKSTLLKMLNGLIMPDKGRIEIKGKVGALIELGSGMNPLLTGRENIFINGQILGFSKQEIKNKLNDIIEFAQIAEFIDTPVQNYSSGMKVRLGFAVAAQMEPDVLIIDEVLAVGDAGFKLKALQKVVSLMEKSAVILVSHSMGIISRYSTRTLLLNHGQIVYNGTPEVAIDKYFKTFKDKGIQNPKPFNKNLSNILYLLVINNQKVNLDPQKPISQIQINEDHPVEILAEYSTEAAFKELIFTLLVNDEQMEPITQIRENVKMTSNQITLTTQIPQLPLEPGNYFLNIGLATTRPEPLVVYQPACSIVIGQPKPNVSKIKTKTIYSISTN